MCRPKKFTIIAPTKPKITMATRSSIMVNPRARPVGRSRVPIGLAVKIRVDSLDLVAARPSEVAPRRGDGHRLHVGGGGVVLHLAVDREGYAVGRWEAVW